MGTAWVLQVILNRFFSMLYYSYFRKRLTCYLLTISASSDLAAGSSIVFILAWILYISLLSSASMDLPRLPWLQGSSWTYNKKISRVFRITFWAPSRNIRNFFRWFLPLILHFRKMYSLSFIHCRPCGFPMKALNNSFMPSLGHSWQNRIIGLEGSFHHNSPSI